jgi:predicted dithiol-disulfide oxidoreductase (DUF899 family)
MKCEKQLMKSNDELAAEKRALPWVKVEKQYFFNSRKGKVSLSDLFESRSQLFVKHFMMGPHQDWQCPGCSLEVDHVAQLLKHFAHQVLCGDSPLRRCQSVSLSFGPASAMALYCGRRRRQEGVETLLDDRVALA